MDELDDPDDVLPRIDAVAFGRFAAAKGIKGDCESCGQQAGWTVHRMKHFVPSLVGSRYNEFVGGPAVIALVSMACKNCGFVRAYDRDFVLQWIRENQDG